MSPSRERRGRPPSSPSRPRSGTRVLPALATIVALAFLLAAPSPAPAGNVVASGARGRALKMIWGPVTLPDGRSAFPTYHRLGVRVLQIDLDWSTTAAARPVDARSPTDPAYVWPAQLDEAVQQAQRYGIRLCLLVQRTPGWANGGRASVWAPNDAADFGDFLVAAARRYPSVHDWMIWGEPNRDGNFQPMPAGSPTGPRRYALLLNAAYRALKRVSRTNTVIGGDTWTYGLVAPALFVRWMRLPDGRPPPLDDYGHNPFSVRFPNLGQPPYRSGLRDLNDIDTLHAELVRAYHRAVKLWLSEYTVSSDRRNRAFAFAVSRKRQAAWLTAAYRLVDSVGYVAGLGWFDLVDEPPSVPGHLTTGLMTSDLRPKPAFASYQHAR